MISPLPFIITSYSIALGLTYSIVLGGMGNFNIGSYTYINSPYWMGTPPALIKRVIIPLQLVALVGIIAWLTWLSTDPPTSGLLETTTAQIAVVSAFFIGSILWPYFTFWRLTQKNTESLVASIVALIVVATSTLTGLVGTVNGPWWAIVSIVAVNVVTVFVDALGWSYAAIVG